MTKNLGSSKLVEVACILFTLSSQSNILKKKFCGLLKFLWTLLQKAVVLVSYVYFISPIFGCLHFKYFMVVMLSVSRTVNSFEVFLVVICGDLPYLSRPEN